MSNLNILNIDMSVNEESKGIELNVNIDQAFQKLLGAELTTQFSNDVSLQNISNAFSILLEKYINLKCIQDKEKPE